MQQQRAEYRGKEGFQTQKQRHDRSLAVALRKGLQRVAHAAREHGDVQKRPETRRNRRPSERFAPKKARREQRRDQKLPAGQDEAVHLFGKMIHRDDLHGKERRAGQQPQIGWRNGEPARNAQKIHARNRDRHRQPDAKRRFFLGKYGRKRHQHDVKRGDKSRFPRLCPLREAELLRIRGCKECRAADKAAQQNILPCAAVLPE